MALNGNTIVAVGTEESLVEVPRRVCRVDVGVDYARNYNPAIEIDGSRLGDDIPRYLTILTTGQCRLPSYECRSPSASRTTRVIQRVGSKSSRSIRSGSC